MERKEACWVSVLLDDKSRTEAGIGHGLSNSHLGQCQEVAQKTSFIAYDGRQVK